MLPCPAMGVVGGMPDIGVVVLAAGAGKRFGGGKLLGDTAAVTALLDRLLHHAHVLKCGPRSWRTKVQTDLRTEEATR